MQSPGKEPEDAAEETSLGQSKCKNSSKNKKKNLEEKTVSYKPSGGKNTSRTK